MPTPIIELQRRLTIVGAIRGGGEKQPSAPGRKLEAWRITSPRQELVEQAAALYGGQVVPWQSQVGPEFQVYTKTAELPVLLLPSYSLKQTYELWEGATKRTRLCDGEEQLDGSPCLCAQEGVDRCDVYSRLVVALRELDTLLGWRVISKGIYAATELPTMVEAARATGGTFVPARLLLSQRRNVKDGQVVRFVVPTLDLEVGYAQLARELGNGTPELEPAPESFVPIPRKERTAAPFGPQAIDPAEAVAPAVPAPEPQSVAARNEEGSKARELDRLANENEKKKLDVLVGRLRDAELIVTEHLYDAVGGRLRGTAGLDVAATTPDYVNPAGETVKALDPDGTLHWSPLRETLTRSEAHYLIERLSPLEAELSRSEASSEPAAGTSAAVPEPDEEAEPEHITVPYNEFPPGF